MRAAPWPENSLERPGPRGRVLIVDDRPDNLLALEAVLEPLDADLVRGSSGEDALRALLSADFALIILDVQMPGMDGFETAQLIKSRVKTRLVPIIFLTASSGEPEHHLQGYRSGAVDYVHKPFSPEALRSKVSVFLDLWRQGNLLELQRVQLANQLAELERLNGELERSNAALERFAAAAAIQIQEPLDNAAGMLDLLRIHQPEHVSDETSLLMTRAEVNVAKVREQVATLLEHARVAAYIVQLEPVELCEVVAEAADIEGIAAAPGVKLVVGDLPTVRGGRAPLVKLFGHLMTNAVRHGGVRPLTVRVEAEPTPAAVIVTVGDNGAGIAAELRPRLFALLPEDGAAFIDDDGGVKAPAGLVVCRRIVEGHGGTIWSERPEGPGTVIRFTLPIFDSTGS